MDDFEKSEKKNDQNPPYQNLSDRNKLPSHPSRSQASDPTLGNNFRPLPLSLQASNTTLANQSSRHESDIASEMVDDIDTEYERDLDGNQQSLSKQGKKGK